MARDECLTSKTLARGEFIEAVNVINYLAARRRPLIPAAFLSSSVISGCYAHILTKLTPPTFLQNLLRPLLPFPGVLHRFFTNNPAHHTLAPSTVLFSHSETTYLPTCRIFCSINPLNPHASSLPEVEP